MKAIFRTMMMGFCLMAISPTIYSQGIASTGAEVPKVNARSETPPKAPEVNTANQQEVTITIRNKAEKPVAIFAGPKEGIRDPKVQTLGGMSLNKLYLRESEVVCLMDMAERKPTACAVIKAGMTTIEVNPSGTTLQSK
ncbi:MAG: hypothetical protein IPP77_02300 [Bacteroidetes bacterium]|nr:hypothetical protein [Bacteroidota bacterium]